MHACVQCRYWLFGEKVHKVKSKTNPKNGLDEKEKFESPKSNRVRVRGWFPRNCAVELMNPESDDEQDNSVAEKKIQ